MCTQLEMTELFLRYGGAGLKAKYSIVDGLGAAPRYSL